MLNTQSFFIQATEKHINLIWYKHGRLIIPVGYIVSGDKGFFGTSGFYVNFLILSPTFLYGNKQFSPQQIDHNIRLCQLRHTCEVIYSNIKNCDRLDGFIPWYLFHHYQDLCDWGYGRANLYFPLQMPAKNSDFFSEVPQHVNNNNHKRSRVDYII